MTNLRKLSRRTLLKRATMVGSMMIAANFIAAPNMAWAYELKALNGEELQKLIQIARDIYPHDHVEDKYYLVAIKQFDDKKYFDDYQDFLQKINTHAQKDYQKAYFLLDDIQREAILRSVETTPFFQTLRSTMITSLYNQKEIWPLFGYEGESFSKGGYLHRGFNDIDWL